MLRESQFKVQANMDEQRRIVNSVPRWCKRGTTEAGLSVLLRLQLGFCEKHASDSHVLHQHASKSEQQPSLCGVVR